MISKWGPSAARRAFAVMRASLDTVRTMIDAGNIECDALEAGHLKIAHRPSRAAELAREAEVLRREFDYPAEFIGAEELRSAHVGGAQSHGALRIPDALAVHPLKLAAGISRIARAAGATVHSASPVTAWEKRGAE